MDMLGGQVTAGGVSMAKIVITGANRGIGLNLVRKLSEQGDHVYALCRSASEELLKLDCQVIEQVDVTDFTSLKKAQNQVGEGIDILINNAGIMRDESLPFKESHFDSIQEQFEVNALGPLKVFSVFDPSLKRGAKVVMITSRMGSISDNTSGGRYGYRASKTALNMLSQSLAHDLVGREMSVGVFHPGWVQTDMTGHTGHLTAEQSAENLCQRIQEMSLKNSGHFFHCDGSSLPW